MKSLWCHARKFKLASFKQWRPCALHHGVQNAMEAMLPCHRQLDPQNVWTGWQFHANYVCSLAPLLPRGTLTWLTVSSSDFLILFLLQCSCAFLCWHDHYDILSLAVCASQSTSSGACVCLWSCPTFWQRSISLDSIIFRARIGRYHVDFRLSVCVFVCVCVCWRGGGGVNAFLCLSVRACMCVHFFEACFNCCRVFFSDLFLSRCLNALHTLQRHGHVIPSVAIFKNFAK